jgi:uncharacterized protein (UPF0332 family)
MEQLLKNAGDFLVSGERDFKEKRFNVAASSFFKAIVVFCDFLIYREIKRLPKNHNDRFQLLELYFEEIYKSVSDLFKVYVKSYNLKSTEEDVINIRRYAYEIEKFVRDKKKI